MPKIHTQHGIAMYMHVDIESTRSPNVNDSYTGKKHQKFAHAKEDMGTCIELHVNVIHTLLTCCLQFRKRGQKEATTSNPTPSHFECGGVPLEVLAVISREENRVPFVNHLCERTLSSSPSSDQAVPTLPLLSRFDVTAAKVRWQFQRRRRRI